MRFRVTFTGYNRWVEISGCFNVIDACNMAIEGSKDRRFSQITKVERLEEESETCWTEANQEQAEGRFKR